MRVTSTTSGLGNNASSKPTVPLSLAKPMFVAAIDNVDTERDDRHRDEPNHNLRDCVHFTRVFSFCGS